MNKNEYYRQIPKMDEILEDKEIRLLCEEYGRGLVLEIARTKLDELRAFISDHEVWQIQQELDFLYSRLVDAISQELVFPLRKVYNGTGIILHTNLGRAPLGERQQEAAIGAMQGYSNLEYDLNMGSRGKRWEHYVKLICKVIGCEGAIAVNNNAAAVMVMLSALTRGKEVIVSRGELIEIGGRFRIPEVMEQSGALLREVGTTNRTRISDYEAAINENTGALLKVHTSNYKIQGFAEDASVEELVELGNTYHLPVLMDLGSGILVNLERYGLPHSPTVQEILSSGADLVCFSGDKLLGGPQAGIIAGKQTYIQRMENHPLMRAVRLDKCTIGALTETFRQYLDLGRAQQNIPVLQMLSKTREQLKAQAVSMAGLLSDMEFPGIIQTECSVSMLGGGTLPCEEIPSYAVTIIPHRESEEEMVEKLRKLDIPLIAYVKNGKVWIDMRTIQETEVFDLAEEMVAGWRK